MTPCCMWVVIVDGGVLLYTIEGGSFVLGSLGVRKCMYNHKSFKYKR